MYIYLVCWLFVFVFCFVYSPRNPKSLVYYICIGESGVVLCFNSKNVCMM